MTKIAELPKPRKWIDYVPVPLFLIGIGLAAFRVVPMVQVAVTLSVIFTLGGWVCPRELPQIVDWRLLILIGSALGLSEAVRISGLSAAAATALKDAGLPSVASLFFLSLLAMVTTELITNNAAAALALPLAIDIAAEQKLASPRPLAMAVMVAASTSYACPIGYATNLMVMGPGGYTFSGFSSRWFGNGCNLLDWDRVDCACDLASDIERGCHSMR